MTLQGYVIRRIVKLPQRSAKETNRMSTYAMKSKLKDIRTNPHIQRTQCLDTRVPYTLETVELPLSLRLKLEKTRKRGKETKNSWNVVDVDLSTRKQVVSDVVLQNKMLQFENSVVTNGYGMDTATEEYLASLSPNQQDKVAFNLQERIGKITAEMNEKYLTKIKEFDTHGIFHPEVNKRRAQSMYIVELQRKLNIGSLRKKITKDMKEYLEFGEGEENKSHSEKRNAKMQRSTKKKESKQGQCNARELPPLAQHSEKEIQGTQNSMECDLKTTIDDHIMNDLQVTSSENPMNECNENRGSISQVHVAKALKQLQIESEKDLILDREEKENNKSFVNESVQEVNSSVVGQVIACSLLRSIMKRSRMALSQDSVIDLADLSTPIKTDNVHASENSGIDSKLLPNETTPVEHLNFTDGTKDSRMELVERNYQHQREEIKRRLNRPKNQVTTKPLYNVISSKHTLHKKRSTQSVPVLPPHQPEVKYHPREAKLQFPIHISLEAPMQGNTLMGHTYLRNEKRKMAKAIDSKVAWEWEGNLDQLEEEKIKSVLPESNHPAIIPLLSADSTGLEMQEEKNGADLVDVPRMAPSKNSMETSLKVDNGCTSYSDKNKDLDSLQERIEKIWKLLETPFVQKLLMLEKYTEHTNPLDLLDAVPYWEHSTEMVLLREKLISFYQEIEKGRTILPTDILTLEDSLLLEKYGLSISQYDDATNDLVHWILQLIQESTKICQQVLQTLLENTGDVLTYRGNNYFEIMETGNYKSIRYKGNPFLNKSFINLLK